MAEYQTARTAKINRAPGSLTTVFREIPKAQRIQILNAPKASNT
jgi:hypothetical protein